MNLVSMLRGTNADAAATLTYKISDADGLIVSCNAATVASQGAQNIASNCPLQTTSALTATVSGAGTPCDFVGMYQRIPIPANLVLAVTVLTNAYQSIPSIIPAAGFASTPWIAPPFTLVSPGGNVLSTHMNGDTATSQLQLRLIRAGVTYDLPNPLAAATGINIRNQLFGIPSLLPGDQWFARVLVAPNVAGSVILRSVYAFVPLLS
jgi:hypothetical protein